MSTSAFTWGDPTNDKRILFLHGLKSSAASFNGLGSRLASDYYCVAPNHKGHGGQPLADSVEGYTFAALAQAHAPYLKVSYDTVVGHSLGCLAALKMLQSDAIKPQRIVLIDPPFNLSSEDKEGVRKGCKAEIEHPMSWQDYQQQHSKYGRVDCIAEAYNASMGKTEAIDGIIDANQSWTNLEKMLSGLHMEITILAADPDCEPAFAPSDAAAVEKVNAGVKVAYVKGASHGVHREYRDIVENVIRTGRVDGVDGLCLY